MKKEMTLNDIKPEESAIVKKINIEGAMKNRLTDIGLIPETHVTCVGISPCGDPKAFLIRGAVIALRSEDSKRINVKVRESR